MNNKYNPIHIIVDMLYPRRCPVCGEIVIPRGELICSSCANTFLLVAEPKCKKCSKPMDNEEKEYCHDCEKNKHHYVKGFSVWVYDEAMKKSIADFKYKGKKEYADYYVAKVIEQYGEHIKGIKPDILVPIPIHIKKERQRGYNQAGILAKEIGRKLNIPVSLHLLQRDKYTLPQKQLNNAERLKNLEKAFSYSKINFEKIGLPIHKVLLIDDIYTTGSTIEACTKILISQGIKEVYFLSLCIGKGF